MSTEMENALARELHEVADGVHVPPMPSLPPPDEQRSLTTRLWAPLLVAAAVVLLVGGLALTLDGRDDPAVPSGPGPSGTPTSSPSGNRQDGTISSAAPTVPYVLDQRLYVDGAQVPGTWWSVESRGGQWLAVQTDGSWWSGGPGRDTGPIAAEVDQPPVMSPNGRYVALIDLSSGVPTVTGFDTLPAGEGFVSAPIELPRTDGGVAPRVRAVTDEGAVIIQGRRISLMWLAQQGGQQTVIDLFETAPDQQVLAATAAGLVVVDGVDSDPQSVPAYLADISADGELTETGTLPTYDDLEISPGGSWLVLSPDGTLGGEVTSVRTLTAQEVAGGDEVGLEAPNGWGFAVGTWAWEDDRTLIAALVCAARRGAARGSGPLRRHPRRVPDPGGAGGRDPGGGGRGPGETSSSEAVGATSAEATLDDVVEAVVAGDRAGLVDQAVIGDGEWDQLVGYAAGGDGSGSTCRDNGEGTRDCEIIFDAGPSTTYYAILEPASNDYGWRISYVGIAHG